MENKFDTKFYVGAVSHRRIKPVSHRFSYKIFSMLINIDELEELDQSSRWFSYNHLGLMAFKDKDHGPKDGTKLRPWIEQELTQNGFDYPLGKVQILCFPRLFGFVFNPLSIWYCHDTEGHIRTILYEVRNTFGEWRGYLLPTDQNKQNSDIRHSCEKAFYVSPLMTMDCRYHFHLNIPNEKLMVGIRETRENERTLLAAQTGEAVAFSDKNLLGIFFKHPLMYFKIIAGIHWEALRTLIKGTKFYFNPRGKTGDVIAHKDN